MLHQNVIKELFPNSMVFNMPTGSILAPIAEVHYSLHNSRLSVFAFLWLHRGMTWPIGHSSLKVLSINSFDSLPRGLCEP